MIGLDNNNTGKILFIIFMFALSLRLLAVFTQSDPKKILYADAKAYDNIAVNIMSGYGFSLVPDGSPIPTTQRTPMYPLFLAGIYIIFGHNYVAVKIIQAILGALSCIIIFYITNITYRNKMVAIIASLITALYVPFIRGFNYYGGPALLLSEYFYIFMLGMAILTTLIFVRDGKKWSGMLSGICIGFTVLTRPEFIVFPLLLIGYLFYISKLSVKRTVYKYFIMYFFMLMILLPWTIRNYIVQKKFIPLTTLNGLVFWLGNNSLANGGWAYPENYAATTKQVENLCEYEQNKVFLETGIKEIKKNPQRMPKLLIKKILVHWAPFEKKFEIFNPYYAILLLLSSIRIFFLKRLNIFENVLMIIFLATTITAVLTWGEPRYRYPYEYFLIVFAAFSLNKIFKIYL